MSVNIRLPAGSRTFRPKKVAGMLLYLRPESFTAQATGTRLANWVDESGNGYDFPTYGPSNLVIQGPQILAAAPKRYLEFFDFGNPYTVLASQAAALRTHTFTFFVALRWRNDGGATQGAVTREAAANGGWNINATAGITRALISNGAAFTYETITPAWPRLVWQLICLECRASDNRVRTFFNNMVAPVTTHNQSMVDTGAPLTLGMFYESPGNAVNGQALPGNVGIGEVLMYNRELTDGERSAIGLYARRRWQIP